MTTNKLEPPKMTKGDAPHAITKTGLSAILVVGGPAVELFHHLCKGYVHRMCFGR